MKLVYEEYEGVIGVCFHILVPGPQAILLFDFIREKYPKVSLAEPYYSGIDNVVYVGNDAYVAYERDRENEFLETYDIDTSENDYNPKEPVTLISKYAIYEASHKEAKSALADFMVRKKLW